MIAVSVTAVAALLLAGFVIDWRVGLGMIGALVLAMMVKPVRRFLTRFTQSATYFVDRTR